MTDLLHFTRQDVSEDLARAAFYNTSMMPERRAEGVVNDYMAEMARVVEQFQRFVTDENRPDLVADLEAYRKGYIKGLHAYLQAQSRIASQFITGAGGWTGRMIRANEKRCNTADRRLDEWMEWRRKFKGRMRRKYDPVVAARAPVSSDDPGAVERLQAKIDAAQARHDRMKAANRVIRGSGTQQEKLDALVELGLTLPEAEALFVPNYMGKIGYQSFQLSNSSANIRRLKGRIATLQREQATPGNERTVKGVRVVEAREDNRLRLFFPGKPPEQVRYELKHMRGFKWAWTIGAWQRQLTDNARAAAEAFLAWLPENTQYEEV